MKRKELSLLCAAALFCSAILAGFTLPAAASSPLDDWTQSYGGWSYVDGSFLLTEKKNSFNGTGNYYLDFNRGTLEDFQADFAVTLPKESAQGDRNSIRFFLEDPEVGKYTSITFYWGSTDCFLLGAGLSQQWVAGSWNNFGGKDIRTVSVQKEGKSFSLSLDGGTAITADLSKATWSKGTLPTSIRMNGIEKADFKLSNLRIETDQTVYDYTPTGETKQPVSFDDWIQNYGGWSFDAGIMSLTNPSSGGFQQTNNFGMVFGPQLALNDFTFSANVWMGDQSSNGESSIKILSGSDTTPWGDSISITWFASGVKIQSEGGTWSTEWVVTPSMGWTYNSWHSLSIVHSGRTLTVVVDNSRSKTLDLSTAFGGEAAERSTGSLHITSAGASTVTKLKNVVLTADSKTYNYSRLQAGETMSSTFEEDFTQQFGGWKYQNGVIEIVSRGTRGYSGTPNFTAYFNPNLSLSEYTLTAEVYMPLVDSYAKGYGSFRLFNNDSASSWSAAVVGWDKTGAFLRLGSTANWATSPNNKNWQEGMWHIMKVVVKDQLITLTVDGQYTATLNLKTAAGGIFQDIQSGKVSIHGSDNFPTKVRNFTLDTPEGRFQYRPDWVDGSFAEDFTAPSGSWDCDEGVITLTENDATTGRGALAFTRVNDIADSTIRFWIYKGDGNDGENGALHLRAGNAASPWGTSLSVRWAADGVRVQAEMDGYQKKYAAPATTPGLWGLNTWHLLEISLTGMQLQVVVDGKAVEGAGMATVDLKTFSANSAVQTSGALVFANRSGFPMQIKGLTIATDDTTYNYADGSAYTAVAPDLTTQWTEQNGSVSFENGIFTPSGAGANLLFVPNSDLENFIASWTVMADRSEAQTIYFHMEDSTDLTSPGLGVSWSKSGAWIHTSDGTVKEFAARPAEDQWGTGRSYRLTLRVQSDVVTLTVDNRYTAKIYLSTFAAGAVSDCTQGSLHLAGTVRDLVIKADGKSYDYTPYTFAATTAGCTPTAGSTFTIAVSLREQAGKAQEGLTLRLRASELFVACEQPAATLSLPANGEVAASFSLMALEGGKENLYFDLYQGEELLQTYSYSQFISGSGYYAGDSHNHSWQSDGRGNFFDNFSVAVDRNLSWIHTADHVTQGRNHWGVDVTTRTELDWAVQQLNTAGFIALKSAELSYDDGTYENHSISYRTTQTFLAPTDVYNYPSVYDAIKADGGFVYLAHPFWSFYQHPQLQGNPKNIDALTNFQGIEILNRGCIREYNGTTFKGSNETFLAVEYWDRMNIKGAQQYFANGNSDAHRPEDIGTVVNKVLLEDLTQENVYEALEQGRFYTTNGPDVRFSIDGANMGEQIEARGTATISVQANDQQFPMTKVVLYRYDINADDNDAAYDNREEIALFEDADGSTKTYSFSTERSVPINKNSFYRVEVYSTGMGYGDYPYDRDLNKSLQEETLCMDQLRGVAFSNPIWVNALPPLPTVAATVEVENGQLKGIEGNTFTLTATDKDTKVLVSPVLESETATWITTATTQEKDEKKWIVLSTGESATFTVTDGELNKTYTVTVEPFPVEPVYSTKASLQVDNGTLQSITDNSFTFKATDKNKKVLVSPILQSATATWETTATAQEKDEKEWIALSAGESATFTVTDGELSKTYTVQVEANHTEQPVEPPKEEDPKDPPKEDPEVPKTGDPGLMTGLLGLLAGTMGLVGTFRRKRMRSR